MKRHLLYILTILLPAAVVVGTTKLHAQQATEVDVPRTISYQGMLTSVSGAPMSDGIYNISVTMYADEEGTKPVWTDSYRVALVGGVFNLYLGNGNAPLPGPDIMSRPLWVGTSVNGSDLMQPLTPLAASPYALTVPNNSITNGKLADNSVTAEKVDMNYVAGIRVNGREFTGRGSVLSLESSDDIDLRFDDATGSVVIGAGSASTEGDRNKKGASLLDAMDGNGNWVGRDPGFGAPFMNPAVVAPIGLFNTLPGGVNTTIDAQSDSSMIGGGGSNYIGQDSDCDVIGAGCDNSIGPESYANVVAGGEGNSISNNGSSVSWATIGGGSQNMVLNPGDYGTVAGGEQNAVRASRGTIGGGGQNLVTSSYGTIGGGTGNQVVGSYGTIGGGQDNIVNSSTLYSFIGGGTGLDNRSSYAVITGGSGNMIATNSNFAVVGGGLSNTIRAELSTIGGGASNSVTVGSTSSTISGGIGNSSDADYGTIGGGFDNSVASGGIYSTIGGGEGNSSDADHGTIGGGLDNSVASGAGYGTVGGGFENTVSTNAEYSTIAGGESNDVGNQYGAIGGGFDNTITINGKLSHIGGGQENYVDAISGVIGGGTDNRISFGAEYATIGGGERNEAQGLHTTIPGGDRLLAWPSYAQTVVGFYNAPRGSVPLHPSSVSLTNDPLFMVGNGDVNATARSNAFEVSYNGHSTVYHLNGSGAANPAIRGATYTDNTLYAWAQVDPSGNVQCDFGVESVMHMGPGFYRVTMNLVDPFGTPMGLDCMSVTATVRSAECAIVTAQPQSPTVFDIHTFTLPGNCQPEDLPFMFQVTGVPNL